jgi:hypothetical protein
MLVWNFQQPHASLDTYIAKATKFLPTDGKKWTEFESSQDLIKPIICPDTESIQFSKLLDHNGEF